MIIKTDWTANTIWFDSFKNGAFRHLTYGNSKTLQGEYLAPDYKNIKSVTLPVSTQYLIIDDLKKRYPKLKIFVQSIT